MATTKKEQAKKPSEKTAQPVKQEKESPKPHPAEKTAAGIFAQIQAKTGLDNKKIDEWQKKWISIPEKRTKYEHLKDAPNVVGEEVYAMANDIIDFIQKEEGGKSVIFKKIKESVGSFIHNPGGFLKQKVEEGKKFAMNAKAYIDKKTIKAKDIAEKGKEKSNETKNAVQAKAAAVKETAGKAAKAIPKPDAAKNKQNPKQKK